MGTLRSCTEHAGADGHKDHFFAMGRWVFSAAPAVAPGTDGRIGAADGAERIRLIMIRNGSESHLILPRPRNILLSAAENASEGAARIEAMRRGE